jgi:hypothetical protein
MIATEFKALNEPVEAEWTSTQYEVTGVVVFGGNDMCTYDGDVGALPHEGIVESCPEDAGIP